MPISIELAPPLAIVTVNNPPVNALSHAVREGLKNACEELGENDDIKAVVLKCDGTTFIAGADIREFGQPPKEPHLPDVISVIESSEKPWIAAIHGTALGGGCEVALGCHYRVAHASAKLGLPEVNLGLIPGAGGTVRLPRLVGVHEALEMVTSGKPVSAQKALDMGLVDKIATDDGLLENAKALATEKVDKPLPASPSKRFSRDEVSSEKWDEIIAGIEKKARGQLSPVEAALAVKDASILSPDEALRLERNRFIKLKESEQSSALRHVFFAERQTSKVAEIKDVIPREISRAGIIGGGTMGAGIAASMLLGGLSVTMIERDQEAAEAGYDRVIKILNASHSRGLIDDSKLAAIKEAFSVNTDYASLAAAELVVEAVFENMDVKKEVFAALEKACAPNTILATNTSYLDIDEIAASTQNPERVIGLHFFSPAHIMKLLEIVKTDTVSPQTLATGFALAKRLRKVPVLAGVCDGFIGNRILASYRKKCDYMLEDGASPQEIDLAMRNYGMAMGPFEMQDLAGLDIGWANRKRLAPTRDPNERYVKIADRICELGHFGQKTGRGWYEYPNGSRTGIPDPIVEKIIKEERNAAGISPRKFTMAEIQRNILQAMVTEGKAILEEGIARSAADIDMVFILGYGFPRYRGGPMFAGGVRD
ncbi:MAG: 3-hydroxyacyl-CoA dehydrogenase NAD-binding domain-containing protein [Pseudomonadota bacterium]